MIEYALEQIALEIQLNTIQINRRDSRFCIWFDLISIEGLGVRDTLRLSGTGLQSEPIVVSG